MPLKTAQVTSEFNFTLCWEIYICKQLHSVSVGSILVYSTYCLLKIFRGKKSRKSRKATLEFTMPESTQRNPKMVLTCKEGVRITHQHNVIP